MRAARYFHGGRLGYKVIDISDEIMAGHVLRCTNSPFGSYLLNISNT